jgi:hypothetical protein
MTMTVFHRFFSLWILLILGVSLMLSGCSVTLRTGPTEHVNNLALSSANRIGQTFTARYNGLDNIRLRLLPAQGSGKIILNLYPRPIGTEPDPASAPSSIPLRTASLPIEWVGSADQYSFLFPSIEGSTGQDYYLQLQIEGTGSTQVGLAPMDSYLDGAAYLDNQPVDAQLSFQAGYARLPFLFGLFKESLKDLAIVGSLVLALLLTGVGVLAACLPEWGNLNWVEKSSLSIGVGAAIYPLLVMATGMLGINLGQAYAIIPPLAGGGLWIWATARHGIPSLKLARLKTFRPQAFDLCALLVFALIFGVRIWQMRSQDAPMWGDSYQHTMMTQLLIDHGGLFNSWQPYAELTTFTYHFGFATLAAVFHWLTGFNSTVSVLWVGQIVNALAVICLYPLATRVGHNRWAGLLAVLIAGLMMVMPSFYINWGRYTQLTGQMILAAAIALAWMALDSPSARLGGLAVAAIALGGLGLTHYRVLIFAIFFLVAYYLAALPDGRGKSALGRIIILCAAGGVLFLPWYMHIYSGRVLEIVGSQVGASVRQLSEGGGGAVELLNPGEYAPAYIWLLAALSLGWSLWRRNRGPALMAAWWLLILLAAYPDWLHLPGYGPITGFAVIVACYIPLSLILAESLMMVYQRVGALAMTPDNPPQNRQTGWVMLILLTGGLIVLLLAGARQRVNDRQPLTHTLLTRPDQRASAWITRRLPVEARLLTNTLIAYGGSSVVGTDGGWWLPISAGRKNFPPPLTYASELGPTPNYADEVTELGKQLNAARPGDPKFLELLKSAGMDYIYIGQLQGVVNNPNPPLRPAELLADSHFRKVYHADRVWIFQVTP